jgi:hypothetical protein
MTDTPNIDDALCPGIDRTALMTPPHKTHARPIPDPIGLAPPAQLFSSGLPLCLTTAGTMALAVWLAARRSLPA